VAQGELSPLLGSGSAPRLSLYVITNPAAQRHAARDRFVQEILAQTPAAPQH
jgi:hypothetical protein